MTARVPVFVHSEDPVLQAGVALPLRGRPDVDVVEDIDCAQVVVLVCDDLDPPTEQLIRAVARTGHARIVLVVNHLDEPGVLCGAEAGACSFLRRSEARPERLASVVTGAAAGDGAVPPDLIGRVLSHLGRKQSSPSEGSFGMVRFSDREVEVLRMIADGLETADIARRLCYSERTVKGVIHEITSRLQLKNRAQAVAFAVRQGLI